MVFSYFVQQSCIRKGDCDPDSMSEAYFAIKDDRKSINNQLIIRQGDKLLYPAYKEGKHTSLHNKT